MVILLGREEGLEKVEMTFMVREVVKLEVNWSFVILFNEKKINLNNTDDFKYYWHEIRGSQKTFLKRKFGDGSIIVWAAISFP